MQAGKMFHRGCTAPTPLGQPQHLPVSSTEMKNHLLTISGLIPVLSPEQQGSTGQSPAGHELSSPERRISKHRWVNDHAERQDGE